MRLKQSVLMFTKDQEPVTLVKSKMFTENTLTFGWYTHKINKHVALNQPIRPAGSADVALNQRMCADTGRYRHPRDQRGTHGPTHLCTLL